MLAGSFLSDHPALKSQWGTLNLDGEMLLVTLDRGTLPPYNLSTVLSPFTGWATDYDLQKS